MHSSSDHLVTPSNSSPSSASKNNRLIRTNGQPSNIDRSESNLHTEHLSLQTKFVITPETVNHLNRHQSIQQKRSRIQWTQRYASFHSSSAQQSSSLADFTTESDKDQSTKMHPSISITDMTAKDFENEYQGENNQPVRCISIPMVSSDEDDELDDDEIDQIINQHDAENMGQEIPSSMKATVDQGRQLVSKAKKKPKSSRIKKPKSSVKQTSPSQASLSTANRVSSNGDSTTLTTPMKVATSITKNDDANGSKSIITVDTSKARSNLEVVRLCLHELGWKESSSNSNVESDIYWHSSSFHEGNVSFPFNSGRVNKFPGMTDLLRKIHLTRSLNNMRLLFPNEYDFYPKTWFLPEQNQQFKDDVRYLHQLDKKHNRSLTTFIVKPSDGSQGEGIYLLRDPSHIISSNRPHVVQEYIDRPLLINGLKFDLRIYVLILNLYPLEIFLYEEGLVRFATVNYKEPSTDNLHQTYMHLTNYSLNKRSANYKHTVDDQQVDGSKRKLTLVWKQLSQMFGNEKVERSKNLIVEMINKTILAILPELRVEFEFELPLAKKQDVSCFQIIGFDVILNEHLKPILLEVNSNPSLRIDFDKENDTGKLVYQPSLIDKEIKKPLILETLKLALPKKKLNTITRHAQIQANEEIMAQRLEKVAQRRLDERNEKMKSARKTRFDMKLNPFFSRPFQSIAKEFVRQQQEQEQYHQHKFQGSSSTHPIIIGQTSDELTAYTLNNNLPSPSQQTDTSHLMKRVNKKPKKERYLPHHDDNESGSPKASVIEALPSAGTKRSFLKSGSTRPNTTTDAAMIKSIETLKLIFPTDHSTKYRHLLVVDKIAYIYIQLVTMVGYKAMTGGQFRNFANICGIINETITAPSIDILYYQMLRKWQQFVLRTASNGLPFAAFIEAFFLLSQRKFPNAPNLLDSVVCLVTICIRHMNIPLQSPASPVLTQTNQQFLHRTSRTSNSTISSSWNIRANLSTLRSPTTTSVHRSSFLTSSASLSKAHSQQSSSLSRNMDDKTQQSTPRHSAKSVFPLFFDVL